MGSEASGETILVVACALMGLSTLVVTGRFYTRFWLRRDGGVDDWLILVALIWALGMTICEGMQVRYGLGSKAQLLKSTTDVRLLKAFWCAIWTYHLSMGTCRLSVVLQCLRIFLQANHGWVKWLMWALAVANSLNMVWAFMSSMLTCMPASKFWHREAEGHCMNRKILYLTNSALAMALDFAVAILPIPWIRSLRLPIRQRVLLSGIFVLAGFPGILSAIRVRALIEVTSRAGSNFSDGILAIVSCAEVYAALICACLPSLKACWNHLRPKYIRRSHTICKWLPCSSCEYFSAGSLRIIPRRLNRWRQGRRRGLHAMSVHDTRVQPPPRVVTGQELEVLMPQTVPSKDAAKVKQSMTEQVSSEAEWRESEATVPRLGVLPSMAVFSENDTTPGTEHIGVLPSVTGYTGTTFVETAGKTDTE